MLRHAVDARLHMTCGTTNDYFPVTGTSSTGEKGMATPNRRNVHSWLGIPDACLCAQTSNGIYILYSLMMFMFVSRHHRGTRSYFQRARYFSHRCPVSAVVRPSLFVMLNRVCAYRGEQCNAGIIPNVSDMLPLTEKKSEWNVGVMFDRLEIMWVHYCMLELKMLSLWLEN